MLRFCFAAFACLIPLATAASAQQTAEPDGAIQTPGMKVIVAPGQVQAVDFTYTPPPSEPRQFKGQWIGGGAANGNGLLLRRVFELPAKPTKVTAWISADPYARTYVNGTIVSRDPDDIGRDFTGTWTHHWFYERRDLTPFLVAGKNVIAVEVLHGVPMISVGPPSYLFEASFELPDGSIQKVDSDTSWKALPAAFYRSVTPPSQGAGQKSQSIQVRDAAKEPIDWRDLQFDDSAWPAAVVSDFDRGPMTPSQIPPCMEAIYPIKSIDNATDGITLPSSPDGPIKITKDGGFSIRFDRVLSAYFNFRVKGPAGAIITLGASEGGGAGGSRRLGAVSTRDGVTIYDSPFIDSFSTINVRVSNVTGEMTLDEPRAVFSSQPVSYRGSFRCSDDGLTKLWQSQRWSLQLCLQTHHLDSPNHYEPICDPGDYLIESIANDYTFFSPWLAAQDLKKYGWMLDNAQYRPFHTCYALMWLQMLSEYYRYTGDAGPVHAVAPYVYKLLDEFASYMGSNGLLCDAPDFMFMDWVGLDGFNLHHPPAVIGQGYMSALFYRALEDGELVAKLDGQPARVEKYDAMRQAIATAYERELWDADKGLYRDGRPNQSSITPANDKKWTKQADFNRWRPADKNIETFTPQNNSMAILYGLAPSDRTKAIAGKIFGGDLAKLNMQPYFWYFAMAAMDRAGVFDKYALTLMHEQQINPASQTVSEMLHGGDLSHAWISAPLINLSSTVLGVTPTDPGYAHTSIRPTPCGLSWAKGTVPTPHGDLSVSWKVEGKTFSLDVSIPPGTAALLTPPSGFSRGSLNAEIGPGNQHIEFQAQLP
jgi:hypothetical protein